MRVSGDHTYLGNYKEVRQQNGVTGFYTAISRWKTTNSAHCTKCYDMPSVHPPLHAMPTAVPCYKKTVVYTYLENLSKHYK